MAEKTEAEKAEQARKMKEGREEKLRKDKEAKEQLLRDTEAEIRASNKDANDEKIKKLLDHAIKVKDADSKVAGAFDTLQKAIAEKVKLSAKSGTISPKEALRIVQKSL